MGAAARADDADWTVRLAGGNAEEADLRLRARRRDCPAGAILLPRRPAEQSCRGSSGTHVGADCASGGGGQAGDPQTKGQQRPQDESAHRRAWTRSRI